MSNRFSESCRWCECSMRRKLNGLLRAALKMDLRVGYAGSRTRYPVGMYEYVHKKSGRHANLSGTAIINQFITVSG